MREIRDLSSCPHHHNRRSDMEIERAFELGVDVVVGQGTTTDMGPNWLGDKSSPSLARLQNKAQRGDLIISALEHKVPFIFSAGHPAGCDAHLETELQDLSDTAKENGLSFKVAVVHGEVDKGYVERKLRSGVKMRRVVESRDVSEFLSIEEVEKVDRLVAQMGPEPIIKALDMGVDGVITGRALDLALHLALPLKMGFDYGLAAHMAKELETGGFCLADQNPAHFAWGAIRGDHFLIKSLDLDTRCSNTSVISLSLYERRNPFREENPGGYLELSDAQYEEIDDYTVRVTGSKWIPTDYTVKLEGACLTGYRSLMMVGIREPVLIEQIDEFLKSAREQIEASSVLSSFEANKDYRLVFRAYGKNGVLGDLEPSKELPHEIGLLVEVVAKNPELADEVLELAFTRIAHGEYSGRITTALNGAMPHSPHLIRSGPVYSFNVWHLLPLEDPCEPFRIEIREFPYKS